MPSFLEGLSIIEIGFLASLAAAGAMLFVISDEIIPETHRRGYERIATYAVVIGFLIMMFLDNTLG